MRIDVVTIFPEYLAPLQLSLLGKAQEQEIIKINVHDLRSNTSDNHHAVDYTPYGGGAGMVMLPEIWGQALDPLMNQDSDLIILTPAGKRFDQPMAAKFSQVSHLVLRAGDMKVLMIASAYIMKTTDIECMKFLLVTMY